MNRLCVSLLLLALTANHGAQAQSQAARTAMPAEPTPSDAIGLPYLQEGVCNSGVLDPQHPPFIHRTGVDFSTEPGLNLYTYAAVYRLVSAAELCGTPPPAALQYLDIGPLPEGIHRISVTPIVDGQSRPAYTVQVQVKTDPGMPSHVSGVWFDPQQGGRGVFVTRMSPERLAVIWFTHDADGLPTWVLATGDIDWRQSQFSAVAINTEGPGLAPSPASIQERVWGELGFRYLGCDRAELSWNAIDPNIVDGRQSLVRLSRPDAMPACAPEFSGRAFWQ